MKEEIKSCPFCGRKAVLIDNTPDGFWVDCKNKDCGASINAQDTKEEAISVWNRRSNELPARSE